MINKYKILHFNKDSKLIQENSPFCNQFYDTVIQFSNIAKNSIFIVFQNEQNLDHSKINFRHIDTLVSYSFTLHQNCLPIINILPFDK